MRTEIQIRDQKSVFSQISKPTMCTFDLGLNAGQKGWEQAKYWEGCLVIGPAQTEQDVDSSHCFLLSFKCVSFSSSCSLFAGVAIDVEFCTSICVFFSPLWLFLIKGSRASQFFLATHLHLISQLEFRHRNQLMYVRSSEWTQAFRLDSLHILPQFV